MNTILYALELSCALEIMRTIAVKTSLLSVIFVFAFLIQAPYLQAQAQAPNYYTDADSGFRVLAPVGWIGVNLIESSVFDDLTEEEQRDVLNAGGYGWQTIADFCPENTAILVVGGGSECPIVPSPIVVSVTKYHFDVDATVEFADIIERGGDITTRDLWAFEMRQERTRSSDLTVTNETDRTTNLIDSETDEVTANNIPVKIVEFTSKAAGAQPDWPPNRTDLRMFVVYNDPDNDEVTAFHVIVGTIDQENEIASPPGTLANIPEVKQILDTFEVLQ
jgi:hypothetical protein